MDNGQEAEAVELHKACSVSSLLLDDDDDDEDDVDDDDDDDGDDDDDDDDDDYDDEYNDYENFDYHDEVVMIMIKNKYHGKCRIAD